MKRTRTFICLLIPFLFYLLFIFTNPLYLSSDNMEVAEVVGGMFGDNNFCQFLHPLLCVLIKPLNSLFPATDVFTTLVHLGIYFTFSLFLYLGLESVPAVPISKWTIQDYFIVALIPLSIAFFSAGVVIWNANYNVQTAFFIFSGLLILAISKRREKRKLWYVFGTLLIAFGFMLRIEAALLFLPFIALKIAIEAIEQKRFSSRHLVPAVLIIALLISSRIVFYNIEPYKSANRYNAVRTDCTDYPMKKWNELDHPDILKADYEAAMYWGLADTDVMTADLLEKAAETGGKTEFSVSDGLGPIFEEMWRKLTLSNLYMFAMFIMTVLLIVRNVILSGKWRKIESILAVLGGFIILLYFTVRGRAPLRVWEPVMFAADYVLISVALHSSSKRQTIDLLFQLFLCICLWFSAGQVMAHNKWKEPATPLNAKVGADVCGLMDTFDPEGIYIWSDWSRTIPWYFRDIDKLPTREVLEHHIPVGDWTYGQPYFEEFLESIDLENPGKALVESEHLYLMFGGKTFFAFLQEHYGEDLIMEEAGEVNGKMAYRVVKAG